MCGGSVWFLRGGWRGTPQRACGFQISVCRRGNTARYEKNARLTPAWRNKETKMRVSQDAACESDVTPWSSEAQKTPGCPLNAFRLEAFVRPSLRCNSFLQRRQAELNICEMREEKGRIFLTVAGAVQFTSAPAVCVHVLQSYSCKNMATLHLLGEQGKSKDLPEEPEAECCWHVPLETFLSGALQHDLLHRYVHTRTHTLTLISRDT